MSFLTPLMLFGAIAAAIPVLIHLFFRSRYKTVPWAAMKFLMTSVEQTSRRLKFQELLLLLLRMLVLAMLAFAFARPISTVVRGSGRGDSVDAVFVIDTSFSMGAGDGSKTRFERAKEEAIRIIDELPAQSTVQIVTCAGNTKTLVGPRSPANLDQAKRLIEELELTHLATDLSVGVAEAQDLFKQGQAANKEFYLFSDMQQIGFEQRAGDLKKTLGEIKDKAIVHFVRCGTRDIKNVAIVGITAQTGIPRPGERVGFAVLVRNTGAETLDKLKVSLMVDGEEKTLETQAIPKLKAGDTYAVTLSGKLDKAGLRVLTARVSSDELEGDNRFDQVILVRDQVNILVVDGNPNDKEPVRASSFFLMHSLVPVKEGDRARYHYNPRMVSGRLASPAMLKGQDVCILVNCALQARAGVDALQSDFIAALEPFVRKGHGLVVFSGDNVRPDAYNKVLGKNLDLLPMPLKPSIKVPTTWEQIAEKWPEYKAKAKERWNRLSDDDVNDIGGRPDAISRKLQLRLGLDKDKADKETDEFGKVLKKPFYVNRKSFGGGPSAFWIFKDEGLFKGFDEVEVWQHLELDEATADLERARRKIERHKKAAEKAEKAEAPEPVEKDDDNAKDKEKQKEKEKNQEKFEQDNPLSVVLRTSTGKALVVSQKIDAGEVIFVATAAHAEGFDPTTGNPNWSDFGTAPQFVPFMNVAVNHLLNGQTQTYNIIAGQSLKWYPKEKQDNAYYLVHPDGKKVDRLGVPEKYEKRFVVTANNLPRAGVYRMAALPRGNESTEAIDPATLARTGTPIAVIPDLSESANLATLTKDAIDERIGFTPIHIVAGDTEAASTAEERLNREWTMWALLAVMVLVLVEVVLAWWCSRSW